MTTALYSFSEAEARKARPQTVYTIIRKLLSDNEDACYNEMEIYLRGAANTGSAQFDHAHCVQILKKHDKQDGGRLHVIIDEKKFTEKEIWDRLVNVLKKANFTFSNGKMTGLLLEDQSEEKASA